MTTYIAENIDTGEIIEGGVRDVARKLGVVSNTIYNSVATKSKVRSEWLISKKSDHEPTTTRISQKQLDEWERVTAPFKKASARKRRVQA